MTKKNFVYLAPSVIPSRAANSVHVVKMCAAIAKLGVDVTLIAPLMSDKEESNVKDIFAFYGVPKNAFKIVWQKPIINSKVLTAFAMALRSIILRPDYVHARHIMAGFFTALMGKCTTLELHQPINTKKSLIIGARILSWIPTVRGVVTNCEALATHTVKILPKFKGRVLAAHNGADVPEKISIRYDESENGIFNVGYVGQLYKGKGMELITQLAPLCPWATFHVVGGYPQDISFWKNSASLIPNINFHGFKSPQFLTELMDDFDVVLAPYQYEVHGYNSDINLASWTSPMKVFEYMAAGKAIICSDLPVLCEVLSHKEDALLCTPDRPEEWKEALQIIYKNPDIKKLLGGNAYKKFLSNYSWEQRAKKVFNFIETNNKCF